MRNMKTLGCIRRTGEITMDWDLVGRSKARAVRKFNGGADWQPPTTSAARIILDRCLMPPLFGSTYSIRQGAGSAFVRFALVMPLSVSVSVPLAFTSFR